MHIRAIEISSLNFCLTSYLTISLVNNLSARKCSVICDNYSLKVIMGMTSVISFVVVVNTLMMISTTTVPIDCRFPAVLQGSHYATNTRASHWHVPAGRWECDWQLQEAGSRCATGGTGHQHVWSVEHFLPRWRRVWRSTIGEFCVFAPGVTWWSKWQFQTTAAVFIRTTCDYVNGF